MLKLVTLEQSAVARNSSVLLVGYVGDDLENTSPNPLYCMKEDWERSSRNRIKHIFNISELYNVSVADI